MDATNSLDSISNYLRYRREALRSRSRRQFMEHDSRRKSILLVSLCVFAALFAGCKKQTAATAPSGAPIPPPSQPTVTINASPTTINPGGTARLSWSSTNATDLDIEPGVGKVSPQGSTPVNPVTSTTYTITANGVGGTASASATVSVGGTSGASQPPPSNTGAAGVSELFAQNVADAYFDLDSSDLRDDARAALTKDAEFLRSYASVHVSIEGHCDERGSTEYNLGLGQRRAAAAKNYLISLGISADRMETTSWGKERPVCTEQTESCWQQNRRAHFVQAK
jgi:peptidoglycan-associated lipoprotein